MLSKEEKLLHATGTNEQTSRAIINRTLFICAGCVHAGFQVAMLLEK